MAKELGTSGNHYPDLLPRMAQFELTLLDWAEQNKGSRELCGVCRQMLACFPEGIRV